VCSSFSGFFRSGDRSVSLLRIAPFLPRIKRDRKGQVASNPTKEENPGTFEIPGFLAILALRELSGRAGGLEAVLSRLVARNPCIYLVFELRHPQFPHSLTTDEILFLPFISPRLRIL
jgi:hypothetical protein